LTLGFQLLLQALILDIANTPRATVRTSSLIPNLHPLPLSDSMVDSSEPAVSAAQPRRYSGVEELSLGYGRVSKASR
jgi:hypothetical protein